jgi:methylated-DNA-[protein]-cysteine S-methyltransferase
VIYYSEAASPIGPLLLTSDGDSLTGVYMSEHRHGPVAGEALSTWGIEVTPGKAERWVRDDEARPFRETKEQIAAYFEGRLTEFDLPLAMDGTEFQRRVWEALREIPYGVTISYGELARRVGNPKGSRAVGLANGRNPISIIVPCHRVIGSNGKLTGYGGGLPRKAALLDFEFSVRVNGPGPFPPTTDH